MAAIIIGQRRSSSNNGSTWANVIPGGSETKPPGSGNSKFGTFQSLRPEAELGLRGVPDFFIQFEVTIFFEQLPPFRLPNINPVREHQMNHIIHIW